MILLMQALNEEGYVERLMPELMALDIFDRIIVIDGGSGDLTVQALKETTKGKAEVYVHPWLDWYHDMNVMQRNVGLSYIPHGETAFILDFDERLSEALEAELQTIREKGTDGVDVLNFPRRTFEVLRWEDSPFAMLESDGFPVESNFTGQYPDYQARLVVRHPELHFVNSPHHRIIGSKNEGFAEEGKDILHYEKDDARERLRIEKKWLRAQARRKELGLAPDVFETRVKPEIAKYADPKTWR